jgi:Right handed beta helix region
MRRYLLIAVLFGALIVVLVRIGTIGGSSTPSARSAVPSARDDAPVHCDLFASPSGSDHHSGHRHSPKATITGLDNALHPGQTGCLLAGDYGSIHTTSQLRNSGRAGARITIRTAPHKHAKLTGLLELQGSYTTLTHLNIDGSNDLYNIQRAGTDCPYPVSNGLEINGTNDIFEHNDYYQSVAKLRGNGIGIGWNGQADNTVIRDNRIHDVGQCKDYDQLVYLSHGKNVHIYNNWMWHDSHGWGVQLYPDATNAQIHDNVIDHAGSGFVIAGDSAGNTIDHNIVLHSVGLGAAALRGVAISTPGPAAPGNSFTDNDSYQNPQGIASATNVHLANNTTSKPNLTNPAQHDYALTENG